jgi:hypothetical protein
MSESRSELETYNYAHFSSAGDHFNAFKSLNRVGTTAPDFRGVLLSTGESTAISSFWRDRDVLIEFGSLT